VNYPFKISLGAPLRRCESNHRRTARDKSNPVTGFAYYEYRKPPYLTDIGNGNGDAPSADGARFHVKPPKPVKTCFHRDGTISIRVAGHWFHDVELDQGFYLSLPGSIRRSIMRRIVQLEWRDKQARIQGVPVVETTNGH